MHQIRFRLGLRPRPRWEREEREDGKKGERGGEGKGRGKEVRERGGAPQITWIDAFNSNSTVECRLIYSVCAFICFACL